VSPAVVVLVMVAAAAIVILSHPKPAPARAFTIIGAPAHVGLSHVGRARH
jgi:hypothetical protein